MTANLLLVIKLSVFVLILAIGMRAHWSDVLHLWQRPRLLVRSLLAMYVLVPLAAFLIVKLFPLQPGAKGALLVIAASAGAPLLPRKLANVGQGAYAFSLVVTSSLLAIVVVPAWVALFAAHFDLALQVAVGDVALIVAKAFLLPLALGMIVRAALPGISDRLANRLLAYGGVVLLVGAVTLLALHWQLLLQVHAQGMIALTLMMVLAIAIGHLLGGPNAEDRAVLAVACATRHIGVAIVVAAAFPGVKTVVLLIVYVLTATVVSAIYLKWRSRFAIASTT